MGRIKDNVDQVETLEKAKSKISEIKAKVCKISGVKGC